MLCLSSELTDRHDFGSSLKQSSRYADILTRSQSKISKQDLLTLTLGSKDFVGVLQIDSDSIDYVAKFKFYLCSPNVHVPCRYVNIMYTSFVRVQCCT